MLCYHIVEAPAAPRMHIDRETFRQHLRYLEMTGYNVIPLRHLYEYVTGKRASLPKNAVVITIDDGWRSTYTEAFPELQKRKFPFTVFIYPNIIGKTSNALTWEQIREMADAGVDIQSHALTHPFLTRRTPPLDERRRVRGLAAQASSPRAAASSRRRPARRCSSSPIRTATTTIASPTAAAKAGYTAALTCDFGRVKKGSDPLKMKRFVIDDKMDFAAFRKYLGATPMQLAEMTPKPGTGIDPGITTISAKIPGYQNRSTRSPSAWPCSASARPCPTPTTPAAARSRSRSATRSAPEVEVPPRRGLGHGPQDRQARRGDVGLPPARSGQAAATPEKRAARAVTPALMASTSPAPRRTRAAHRSGRCRSRRSGVAISPRAASCDAASGSPTCSLTPAA